MPEHGLRRRLAQVPTEYLSHFAQRAVGERGRAKGQFPLRDRLVLALNSHARFQDATLLFYRREIAPIDQFKALCPVSVTH